MTPGIREYLGHQCLVVRSLGIDRDGTGQDTLRFLKLSDGEVHMSQHRHGFMVAGSLLEMFAAHRFGIDQVAAVEQARDLLTDKSILFSTHRVIPARATRWSCSDQAP